MKNIKNIEKFISENSDIKETEKLDFIINHFEIQESEFKEESINQYLSLNTLEFDDLVNLLDSYENIIHSDNRIMEDGDGGGVAAVSSGTTSGMGNVSSAQPASTPGAAFTGDGTVGSGDYGNPLFPTAQKDGSNTLGKKRGKKGKKNKKKESIIQNFLSQYKANKGKNSDEQTGVKKSKVFSFKDFVDNDIKK